MFEEAQNKFNDFKKIVRRSRSEKFTIFLVVSLFLFFCTAFVAGTYIINNQSKKEENNVQDDQIGERDKNNTNTPKAKGQDNIPSSATPTSTNLPSPTPTSSPNIASKCSVNVLADENSQMAAKLVYGLYNESGGSNTMVGAQWDFDGDGSWDTDVSLQNGTITHTFPSQGTYNVRLRLELTDGSFTEPCTKQLSLPMGVQVSYEGFVFSDTNCNKVWDPGEGYLSGVEVTFVRLPGYSVYKKLTSDENGKFSFTSVIDAGDNLTVIPSAKLIPNYSDVYQAPSYTLNSQHPTASGWLSLIPNENVPVCH